MFAHPADVAYADQASAAMTGVIVKVSGLVPPGRMYVVAGEQADGIHDAFELEQFAEEILTVEPPGLTEHGERL